MTLPTAVKAFRGTLKPSRINANEPKPELGLPAPPDDLSPLARTYYLRAASLLNDMKALTKADVFVLAGFAKVAASLQEVETTLASEGRFYRTDAGLVKVHPGVRMAADLSRQYLAYLGQMGLTGASRAKLNAAPAGEDENPFAALVQK